MNEKRANEQVSLGAVVAFDSEPPPPGAGDVHNARTTVAPVPDAFLEGLKRAPSGADLAHAQAPSPDGEQEDPPDWSPEAPTTPYRRREASSPILSAAWGNLEPSVSGACALHPCASVGVEAAPDPEALPDAGAVPGQKATRAVFVVGVVGLGLALWQLFGLVMR